MAGGFIETVSLDTQVFVDTGFCLNSKAFQALKDYCTSGRLKLVMSDITVREIRANIRKYVAAEVLLQRQFCNKADVLYNSAIPSVKASMVKFDEKAIADDLCNQFDHFLTECNAEILDSTSLSAGDVLDKYFAEEPPFGKKEEKKHEFPDAFAIQALSEWAENHDIEMFAVSEDKLFFEACEKAQNLIPKKTLAEVLDHVASDDNALADFLRAQTMARIDEIAEQVTEEFEDQNFWVEDEDGDATVEVTDIVPTGDPEIIEIDEEEAALQYTSDVKYTAHLSYKENSIYSEGILVYFEDRNEDVHRTYKVTVQVEVMFEHTDPDKFDIVAVSLIDMPKGFGIKTDFNEGWPWK